jgi:hypothetical protein
MVTPAIRLYGSMAKDPEPPPGPNRLERVLELICLALAGSTAVLGLLNNTNAIGGLPRSPALNSFWFVAAIFSGGASRYLTTRRERLAAVDEALRWKPIKAGDSSPQHFGADAGEYIARPDIESELRNALASKQPLVLLAGRPGKAGRSRLAQHVVSVHFPQATLIVPKPNAIVKAIEITKSREIIALGRYEDLVGDQPIDPEQLTRWGKRDVRVIIEVSDRQLGEVQRGYPRFVRRAVIVRVPPVFGDERKNEWITINEQRVFCVHFKPDGFDPGSQIDFRLEAQTDEYLYAQLSQELRDRLPNPDDFAKMVAEVELRPHEYEDLKSPPIGPWSYEPSLTNPGSGKLKQLRMIFRESSYRRLKVKRAIWERLYKAGNLAHFTEPDLMCGYASHSFGLNVTVALRDRWERDYLMLGRRGTKTSTHQHLNHTSVNEGAELDDVTGRRVDGALIRGYDPIRTVLRGFKEELGGAEFGEAVAQYVAQRPEVLRLYALFVYFDRYEWGMMAHLDLTEMPATESNDPEGSDHSFERLLAARKQAVAVDRQELVDVSFVPFDPQFVANLLKSTEQWTSFGYLNVLWSTRIFADAPNPSTPLARLERAILTGSHALGSSL